MKKILKVLVFLLSILNISFAFAGTIDHFIVEFPKDKAMQYEALDLTIKAVDENWDIVKDYTWNVIWISETDDNVELPADLASDNWYTFKLSDGWVKKFENWVKFSTTWLQTLSVYDSEDFQNLIWKWEITIIESQAPEKNIEIEIVSPETNTTIAKDSIKISWATKKNHQVRIEVNSNKNFNTTSNSDWIFEKEIDW